MPKKLDTAPYKGVRDFYPEEMAGQNYIFAVLRKTAESFGYEEYNASPLEPAELYRAKTGDEIVNEQTYTFTDRGGREVTLRPEMTPTVARMVAARRRELPFPLRWYSIGNFFRYESPQRGRLREHYQLNADTFGIKTIEAEIEIITLAWKIMKNFGAEERDFEIRINSRRLMNDLFASFEIPDIKARELSKIIDKKEKVGRGVYEDGIRAIAGDSGDELIRVLNVPERIVDRLGAENASFKNLEILLNSLSALGIGNVVFTPSLMRGFDYYTDIVFEVYDKDPDNRRSLFGGGRYDSLTELFGGDALPAVGFGMGDVTLREFLSVRNLLPPYVPPSRLYVCIAGAAADRVFAFANRLRKEGVNVSVDFSGRKIGEQIKAADKMKIPYIVCIGEEELKTNTYKVKHLSDSEETTLPEDKIADFIRNNT